MNRNHPDKEKESSDTEKAVGIIRRNLPEIGKVVVQIIGIAITCALAIWKLGTYFSDLTSEIKAIRADMQQIKTSYMDLDSKRSNDHDEIIELRTRLNDVERRLNK